MTWIEALLLGVLQGITEFLPVSSSGHLVIGKELLGIETQGASLEVLLHAATVLSIITVFWKEIVMLLRACLKFRYSGETHYVLMLIISMLPVLVVGIFFKPQIEALFGSGLALVGSMLLVTAALLLLGQILSLRGGAVRNGGVSVGRGGAVRNGSVSVGRGGAYGMTGEGASSMTVKDAFVMGVAQAVAVLPGLSRSGATISTGLLLGKDRGSVATFSFLMVLVPILGEAFLDLAKGGFHPQASGIPVWSLLIGFIAAYLTGLAACRWMVALVKKAKLWGFAIYCALAGSFCLLYYFLR